MQISAAVLFSSLSQSNNMHQEKFWPSPKMSVLAITINCIRWWGSCSEDLGSRKTFIAFNKTSSPSPRFPEVNQAFKSSGCYCANPLILGGLSLTRNTGLTERSPSLGAWRTPKMENAEGIESFDSSVAIRYKMI